MRTYLFIGSCAVLFAFITAAATRQSAEAGAVVPRSGSSEDGGQAEALPGLPNYAVPEDEEETRKRMRRQQQPSQTAPGQTGAAAAQMPLPPTYTPGAPASYGQPASAAQLPMAPTAYGTYNTPGFNEFGMPAPGQQAMPGQAGAMGMQPGGQMMMPPSPTAQTPISPGNAGAQQFYGPHSPTGVRQATTPQPAVSAHRQPATMPAGSKPFEDYHRKSAYSPYMSLFRTQDADRGINNYYSYVKPYFDQSHQNRRVNKQISGLQNSSRYQNLSIEQINQQNRARQRPGNVIPGENVPQRMPATYMNLQQYYPGLR